mgnify:CR=1 FL=1
MPNRDNSGPNGQGSMTGRQLGNCVPNEEQVETVRPRLGRQLGRRGSFRGGNRAGNRPFRGNGNVRKDQ